MERKNPLLGRAEVLTSTVPIPASGGPKPPPYPFERARARVEARLKRAVHDFDDLGPSACPGDVAVASLTLHPRYLSKSDYPNDFLSAAGLVTIGSRPVTVAPEAWGVARHPAAAPASMLYVAGPRSAFRGLLSALPGWREGASSSKDLTKIEDFNPVAATTKLHGIPDADGKVLFEAVLHNDRPETMAAFVRYASAHGFECDGTRIRTVGGLAFVPVRGPVAHAESVAEFTLLRVLRGMPMLRPVAPHLLRSLPDAAPRLPTDGPHAPREEMRIAVFDGGLPPGTALARWATAHETAGIGAPVADYQAHGLAVTSALLFGSLGDSTSTAARPVCHVDHFRVLDDKIVTDDGYNDVLDRIVFELRSGAAKDHRFVNVSLGPDLPADDNDITRWTAEFDALAVGRVLTVAAGNSGARDALSGLNRIQIPSDGVNVLAVGACDNGSGKWLRAPYSSVGPGRCPGMVKPDGVAFGGTVANPFVVLGDPLARTVRKEAGTSFASPLVLRMIAGVKASLGPAHPMSPLALRALAVHTAESDGPSPESGWGRFQSEPMDLLSSAATEAQVVYQGVLPSRVLLRAPIPLPRGLLAGDVQIRATLCISPLTDISHSSTYTRQGVEVTFRPDSRKRFRKDGAPKDYADTLPLFSESKAYTPEFKLREKGKWEPVRRAISKPIAAAKMHEPCLDIQYHQRSGGAPLGQDAEIAIPYALVVTISAPGVPNFYDRLRRDFPMLQALVPVRTELQLRA